MRLKYTDIAEAVFFVSDAHLMDHAAVICRSTGEICLSTEDGEIDQIPEEVYESDEWVAVPEFRDIGCGSNLVHEFIASYAPREAEEVQRIFHRPGAYGRFKDLLANHGLLEEWYQFESAQQETAIRDWCAECGIDLEDDAGPEPEAGVEIASSPRSMYFVHRIDEDITLTLLTEIEAQPFYDLVVENRDHLTPWLSFAGRYSSVSEALSFARESLGRLAEGTAVGCLVWYRSRLAGWVELLNIRHPEREAEIGFWLGREFEGKGIASRAATAMIEHAFTSMDIAAVDANLSCENVRSQALLDRLGFSCSVCGKKSHCRLTREAWHACDR